MPDYFVTSQKIDDSDELESEWLELQERSDCSYFQSWGWIRTWLEHIALDKQPLVIRVWLQDRLVGAGIFIPRNLKRHIFIRSRGLFLNEYPFDGNDMVIEYNGFLSAKGHEKGVIDNAVIYLLNTFKEFEEVYFSAVESRDPDNSLLDIKDSRVESIINERSTSWSIDLGHIASGVDGVLTSLSKNRRSQIRRSIRIFEEHGIIRVEEASSVNQALNYFDNLKKLHMNRWRSKGRPGSFANPVWEGFHRSLIRERFEKGEIQLVKVCHDEGEIGYLYNFIWRGRVYVLQTGFIPSASNHMMPGYVTHVYSIAHNKSRGMAVYDLMHGDDIYKRILCDCSNEMVWLVIQRKRLKFLMESLALRTVRSIRHLGK